MEPETLDELLAAVQALYRRKRLSRPIRLIVECSDPAHNLNVPIDMAEAKTASIGQQVPASPQVPAPRQITLPEAITTAIICAEHRLPATEVARQVEAMCPNRWEHRSIVNECSRMARDGKLSHHPEDPEDGYQAGYGVLAWLGESRAEVESQNE